MDDNAWNFWIVQIERVSQRTKGEYSGTMTEEHEIYGSEVA